jgi:hypothetical protein
MALISPLGWTLVPQPRLDLVTLIRRQLRDLEHGIAIAALSRSPQLSDVRAVGISHSPVLLHPAFRGLRRTGIMGARLCGI